MKLTVIAFYWTIFIFSQAALGFERGPVQAVIRPDYPPGRPIAHELPRGQDRPIGYRSLHSDEFRHINISRFHENVGAIRPEHLHDRQSAPEIRRGPLTTGHGPRPDDTFGHVNRSGFHLERSRVQEIHRDPRSGHEPRHDEDRRVLHDVRHTGSQKPDFIPDRSKDAEEGNYERPRRDESYGKPSYDEVSQYEVVAEKECNCLRWTNWISADTPSDSGDFETLGPPDEKGKVGTIHHVRPDVCTFPLRMECRTLHDYTPWYLAYEQITDKCSPHGKGFSCENKKQVHGKCKDYEVRLLCFYADGNSCPCLYWTDWFDNDDPTDKGDEELIGRKLPEYVCGGGYQPVDVQCESVSGLDVYHSGNKKVQCNLEGLSCYNEDQGRNCKCHDYRVRFLCPKFPSNYPVIDYDFNSNKTVDTGDYGTENYDGKKGYDGGEYKENKTYEGSRDDYGGRREHLDREGYGGKGRYEEGPREDYSGRDEHRGDRYEDRDNYRGGHRPHHDRPHRPPFGYREEPRFPERGEGYENRPRPPAYEEERRGHHSPAYTERPVHRPPHGGYEKEIKPSGGYEDVRKPSGGYEDVRKPSGGYEEERKPTGGYEDERKPTGGYEDERKPLIGYEEERKPLIGYEEEIKPSSDYNEGTGADQSYSETKDDDITSSLDGEFSKTDIGEENEGPYENTGEDGYEVTTEAYNGNYGVDGDRYTTGVSDYNEEKSELGNDYDNGDLDSYGNEKIGDDTSYGEKSTYEESPIDEYDKKEEDGYGVNEGITEGYDENAGTTGYEEPYETKEPYEDKGGFETGSIDAGPREEYDQKETLPPYVEKPGYEDKGSYEEKGHYDRNASRPYEDKGPHGGRGPYEEYWPYDGRRPHEGRGQYERPGDYDGRGHQDGRGQYDGRGEHDSRGSYGGHHQNYSRPHSGRPPYEGPDNASHYGGQREQYGGPEYRPLPYNQEDNYRSQGQHEGEYSKQGPYQRPKPARVHKPRKVIASGVISKATFQEGVSSSAVNFKSDFVNVPEHNYENEGYVDNKSYSDHYPSGDYRNTQPNYKPGY